MKSLTWDDLADFYKQKTGGRARIRPMDEIYEWAKKQPEIKVNKDSSLSFIKGGEHMTDFFKKDEDFSIPVTSMYMKFSEGDNTFRILGSFSEGTAIQGIEYWKTVEGTRKPIRITRDQTIPASELELNPRTGEPEFPKYFWAFPVWNYQDKKIQILEITQKTILNYIKKQISNPKWGNPLDYDFTVTKGKPEEKPLYTISNNPKEPLDKEILVQYKALFIDIEALFRGENPFKEDGAGGAGAAKLADDADKALG